MKFKGLAKCIPRDRDAIFLPYQSKWIKDTSRLKLGEKARQLGWTWSAAYAADERAAAQHARFDEWVSSRDELQAKLFIEDCPFICLYYRAGAILTRKMFTKTRDIREPEVLKGIEARSF